MFYSSVADMDFLLYYFVNNCALVYGEWKMNNVNLSLSILNLIG